MADWIHGTDLQQIIFTGIKGSFQAKNFRFRAAIVRDNTYFSYINKE